MFWDMSSLGMGCERSWNFFLNIECIIFITCLLVCLQKIFLEQSFLVKVSYHS